MENWKLWHGTDMPLYDIMDLVFLACCGCSESPQPGGQ